jgi:hypothetical protein
MRAATDLVVVSMTEMPRSLELVTYAKTCGGGVLVAVGVGVGVGVGVDVGVEVGVSVGVAVGDAVGVKVAVAVGVAVGVGVCVGVAVGVSVGVGVRVGVNVGVVVGVAVGVSVGVGVRVDVAVGVNVGVGVTVGVFVDVGVFVGVASKSVMLYVRSSTPGGESRLRARMRSCADPVPSIWGALVAANPVTLNAAPALHGADVASSHGVSVTGTDAAGPLFRLTSNDTESGSMPLTASATLKVMVTGSATLAPGPGLSNARNGLESTSMSPPPARLPARMVTGVEALSKLGAAGVVVSHAAPTPGGLVGQISVMPGGAGAKLVAKPAIENVPGPSIS